VCGCYKSQSDIHNLDEEGDDTGAVWLKLLNAFLHTAKELEAIEVDWTGLGALPSNTVWIRGMKKRFIKKECLLIRCYTLADLLWEQPKYRQPKPTQQFMRDLFEARHDSKWGEPFWGLMNYALGSDGHTLPSLDTSCMQDLIKEVASWKATLSAMTPHDPTANAEAGSQRTSKKGATVSHPASKRVTTVASIVEKWIDLLL
jgi:hypothetical protein